MNLKAVILAGGGGTRLWPLSTPERPKQFQKLVSDKTMLEETIERLDFLEPQDIYIAINQNHLELTQKLCPQIPKENIIIEPALRDTSSCIGFAAAKIAHSHPEATMAVIYADHLVQNKLEFQEKIQLAAKIAQEQDTLNIVEVVATEPNTNYGYVKLGPAISEYPDTYQLDSFKEKPDLETAKQFLTSGDYLWNTGIYVWKAATLLNHYQKLQPDTHQKFKTMQESFGSPNEQATVEEIYPTLEKISIDFAIMERVDPQQVRIIKAELGWSDIGNWQAIWEKLASQQEENILRGDIKELECQGCLVYEDTGRPIKVLGLEDLIVVSNKDGIFIAPKSQSHRIKEVT